MVQWTTWWWAAAGCLALALVAAAVPLSPAAWAAGIGYLVISSALLSIGLRRHGMSRFGPANAVTATRSTLVAVVTAMTVASFDGVFATPLFVSIATCALALDAVDGFVARRTRSESALGARFDMEVDAFLMLVLCVYDVRFVGWWVLAIGLMRYAFVAVGWALPWMRAPLPPRYWRKVVTAACGIALTIVAAQMVPPILEVVIVVVALLLLVESFGRDTLWLFRERRTVVFEHGVVPAEPMTETLE
jgi:phosphatidylglycerophosphate synthase